MATSLLSLYFFYFDIGKRKGTKQMMFLKKGHARSLKCTHKLHPARRFMETGFAFPRPVGF